MTKAAEDIEQSLDREKLDSVEKIYERIGDDESKPAVETPLIAETDPPLLLKEAEELYEKLEEI